MYSFISHPAFLKPRRFQFDALQLIKQVAVVLDVILAHFQKQLYSIVLQQSRNLSWAPQFAAVKSWGAGFQHAAAAANFSLPGCNLLIIETLTHNLNYSFAMALSSH